MNEDEARDDEALSRLNTVDTCVNVDGVCAEDCQHAHVDVIDDAKINHRAD